MIYTEPWVDQRKFLLNLFTAEMLPGGRLTAFKSLSVVAPPEGQLTDLVFPILAFEFNQADEDFYSTAGNKQQGTFTIAAYALTRFDPGNVVDPIRDPVKRTKLALENLWNDGAGNGVGPVLRSDPTMGGICIYTRIAQTRSVVSRGPAEAAVTSGVITARFITFTEFPGL